MTNPAATASMDLGVELHHGDPHMIDYTPSGDTVKAGGTIAMNANTVLVAHSDIGDGELGALAFPGGQATYRIKLAAAATFAFGAQVLVTPDPDGGTEAAAGGSHHFGYAVAAADQGAGDTHVIAVHAPHAGTT